VRDEVARLRPQGDPVGLRVPDRREHDVAGDEPHGSEAEPPVPHREVVETHGALQPRDARHEEDLDEDRVRSDERRQLTGRGGVRARTAQIAVALRWIRRAADR